MNSPIDNSFNTINNYLAKFPPSHTNWKNMPGLREALKNIIEYKSDFEEYTYTLPISNENGQLIPIDIRTGNVNSDNGDIVYLDLENNYVFTLEENDIYSYIGYWDEDKKKVIPSRDIKKKNIEKKYENITF